MPKRAGRKSLSQTPAPTKDRVIGSKINPKGSAMSKTSAKNIKFSAKTIDTLKNKLTEFKKKYPTKGNVSISDLKAVYRRGSGAYSGSHRPTITGGAPNSRAAWSFARVNKFLEKAAGKQVKKAYVQDDDLLKYESGGEMNSITKNGILITDEKSGIIAILYNTGNQSRKLGLYNTSLLYKTISEIDKDAASRMVVNINQGIFDEFDKDNIGKYKNSKILFIFNQNEVLYNSNNPDIPDIKYGRGGKTKSSGGDCYYIAGSLAMDFSKKIDYIGTPHLVHAEVQGQGAIANLRYGHAWVEDDVFVYDYSNVRELVIPKQLYYHFGDIKTENPKKYQKYTFAEARKKMLDTKHYGCWDIEVDYANGGTLNYKAMEDKMVALPDTYSNPTRLNEVLNAQGYGLVEKPMFKPHKSVYQIAEEQDVPIDIVKHQLVKGMDVESEHSDNIEVQETIALQHLDEDVFYYQKLKMKGGGYFKSGGEVKPDDKGTKDMITHKSGEAGGMLVGNRHSEGGIKAINKSNGQPLEMEGGEVVITRNAVSDNSKHEFEGEMLTNRQILSRINESGGGVSFADGGDIPNKCSCSGKSYKFGGDTLKDSEIVGRINSRYDKSMEGIVYPELKDSERLEKLYVPNEQYEKAVNLYGEGGMVRLVHKKVPSYKAFANKHKEISQPMMKKSYKLYLQKNYGIDFNKLPHNLQVALLIGSQTLIDKYLNS